jgi:hypothetical protein
VVAVVTVVTVVTAVTVVTVLTMVTVHTAVPVVTVVTVAMVTVLVAVPVQTVVTVMTTMTVGTQWQRDKLYSYFVVNSVEHLNKLADIWAVYFLFARNLSRINLYHFPYINRKTKNLTYIPRIF